MQKYFKENDPIRKNLEFFIPLRNKIEHKFLPKLDPNIFAECESMLLNFDKVVESEFGEKYCLRESLSFALQLYPSAQTLKMATRSNSDYSDIISFIEQYRSSIGSDIINTGEYAFKAFLIQVANHNAKDCLPIQFFSYDKMSDDEKKTVERIAAFIKEKRTFIANMGLMKPGAVVKCVQRGLGNPQIVRGKISGDKFNFSVHTLCWKKYKVRPAKNDPNPEQTNTKYCVYDEPNNSYLYTQAWIDFLVDKMRIPGEYESLYK